ncbi:MAG: phosphoethanolamine transferase [Succinivibrio sp.]
MKEEAVILNEAMEAPADFNKASEERPARAEGQSALRDRAKRALRLLILGQGEARRPGALHFLWWTFLVCLWWCTAASLPFWQMSLSPLSGSIPDMLRFGLATLGCLVFAHMFLILVCSALLPLAAAGAVTAILGVIAAVAFAFSYRYNAAMTPEMIQNALETDTREARDLMTPQLALCFLAVLLPQIPLLARMIRARARIKVRVRMALLGVSCAMLSAAALFTDFSGIAIYMREHHDARYFIAPSDAAASAVRALTTDASSGTVKREIIDKSPLLAPSRRQGRPVVVVTVVGETAREKNWGLSGYARDTTPELRTRNVINFTDTWSCGTSTAESVPCVFSVLPRADYSKKKARAMEQLPSLVSRAGVKSIWIDNQAGSKDAAAGIEEKPLSQILPKEISSAVCEGGVCPDGALARAVKAQLDEASGPTAVYLHMMGSHGPAYADRYPPSFQHWGPVCRQNDLRQCQLSELRNAYDNTIYYTDSVLASIIDALKERKDLDTALVYFSDHGESLGDDGFFLHGAPYAIAPEVQKKVPMIMWFSDGFEKRTGLDPKCLLKKASEPASHDNIYHTLLDLNGVSSSTYDPSLDLMKGCEKSSGS